jgi:transposase
MVDRALADLDADFNALYSDFGRDSIPPEKLLRAQLLMALYTIRSERQLVKQINYNLLFRWFVGFSMDDEVWNHSTFTKNRDRLLGGEIARRFFTQALGQAEQAELLSKEHFIVDGTMIEALGGTQRVTPGADKNYDTRDCVDRLRCANATPHVAQNASNRSSAIDGRTTRHEGYEVSQRFRKRIEECFGWAKTIGGLRKSRFVGREKLDFQFVLTMAAYNLVRMRNLGVASCP